MTIGGGPEAPIGGGVCFKTWIELNVFNFGCKPNGSKSYAAARQRPKTSRTSSPSITVIHVHVRTSHVLFDTPNDNDDAACPTLPARRGGGPRLQLCIALLASGPVVVPKPQRRAYVFAKTNEDNWMEDDIGFRT